MTRCRHGMIKDQCGVCKHLPVESERKPLDIIKPVVVKAKVKAICEYCKKKEAIARGLCPNCLYHWKKGNITHPVLGPWFPKNKNSRVEIPEDNPRDAIIQQIRENMREIERLITKLENKGGQKDDTGL